jgi:glyoxylase-like metal-dependent hydrolase (beta-lactamase superfamily II)
MTNIDAADSAAEKTRPETQFAPEGSFSYGDVIEIATNARLIVGLARDMEKNIPNIANAVMYKVGSTLVVIDNGATEGFREYLNKASDQLRPFNKAILLITHGHCDHTGNNGWIDTLGVPAVAYISNADLSMMRDQAGTYAPLVDSVAPFVPHLPSGKEFAAAALRPFGKLDLDTKSLQFFETLPLERIEIGTTLWNGWRLLDGEVIALQTTGHTVGHVAVCLPGIKHLHFADETTSYYQALANGTPQANLLSLERGLTAFKEGALETLTDGHTFRLYRKEEAISYLDGLVHAAFCFQQAVVRILREHSNGITIPNLLEAVRIAPEMAGAPGEATLPALRVMQIINKLHELGLSVPSDSQGLLKFPQ